MGRHGPKGIFKSTDVPKTTAAYRLIFSKSTAGIITSAAAAKWLGSYLNNGRIMDIFPPGMSPKPWQVVAGTAAVGFGCGYGLMQTLHWTRMKAIKALLSYQGWMFNQKAKSTMVWGLLLKLLVGPGPHSLHDFDEVMPSLPVPSLEETCKRYLTAVQCLLTAEEFERTKLLVDDLLQNDGPKLQNYLVQRFKKKKNWLADWWLTNAYLAKRDPIALNVNFFMMGGVFPEVSSNALARSANIIYDTMVYYGMIKDGSLPPDIIMNMVPTCMDGVKYMMASTRIPGDKCDTLQVFPESSHVVIICKGRYFVLEMFPKDKNGVKHLLNKHEIKKQLNIIWQQTRALDPDIKVASLTTQNRGKWAKDRAILQKNNKEVLDMVESAIFIVVLAEEKPNTITDMAKCALMGDGGNRWFDKSLLLEVWNGCAMGAGNMEHTGTDATHFAVMWEHVLQLEDYGPDGDLLPLKRGQVVRDNLPLPQMLKWNIDAEVKATIDEANQNFQQQSNNMDMIIHHSEFGRNWMKSRKVSPDGFLQMAIQLAFWRLHGCFSKTYEPASHRLFSLGRTDNINPVSDHSIAFVRLMEDRAGASVEDKVAALKAAIGFQSAVRLEATAGYGCDRHMLGLECAAREMGMDTPGVFTDKAYTLPMRLSTSQVPTSLGHLGLNLVPESIAGGFGPACEDGYGVLYCSVGDDMFNFSITSWKTVPETDSTRFAGALQTAMNEMRELLDGKPSANKSQNNANL